MSRIKEETIAPKMGKWWPYFRDFWLQGGFDPIYEKLQKDTGRGIIVCPDTKDTYRSFSSIDPEDVKVIWTLLDPYSQVVNKVMYANGIAMDGRHRNIIQPSQEKFYGGIENSEGKKLQFTASLQYLIDQGNMFFNTALTVPKDKTGAHLELWADFMKYFYDVVMNNFSGLIYVLCGKESHQMEKWINPLGNYIFKLEHPSFANRQERDWEYKDIFKKINYILKGNNGPDYQIEWDPGKYKPKQKSVSEVTDEEIVALVGDKCPF